MVTTYLYVAPDGNDTWSGREPEPATPHWAYDRCADAWFTDDSGKTCGACDGNLVSTGTVVHMEQRTVCVGIAPGNAEVLLLGEGVE